MPKSPSGEEGWTVCSGPVEDQLERIQPSSPTSRGVSRGDDRKVVSGIIHVLRSGLRSRGCPSRLWTLQDPHQPLPPLVGEGRCPGDPLRVGPLRRRQRGRSRHSARGWCGARRGADDGCHLRQGPPHRLQPQKGGADPRLMGRTKGGLTSKRPVVWVGRDDLSAFSSVKGLAATSPVLSSCCRTFPRRGC